MHRKRADVVPDPQLSFHGACPESGAWCRILPGRGFNYRYLLDNWFELSPMWVSFMVTYSTVRDVEGRDGVEREVLPSG